MARGVSGPLVRLKQAQPSQMVAEICNLFQRSVQLRHQSICLAIRYSANLLEGLEQSWQEQDICSSKLD